LLRNIPTQPFCHAVLPETVLFWELPRKNPPKELFLARFALIVLFEEAWSAIPTSFLLARLSMIIFSLAPTKYMP